MLQRYQLLGELCPDETSGESAFQPRLQVHHLAGLFILTFAILGAAVLGALAELVLYGPHPVGESSQPPKAYTSVTADGHAPSTSGSGVEGVSYCESSTACEVAVVRVAAPADSAQDRQGSGSLGADTSSVSHQRGPPMSGRAV